MGERVLAGVPASPGAAIGAVLQFEEPGQVAALAPAEERERAREALRGAARELEALAARLRDDGRADEAAIVETGALMAEDPTLVTEVEARIERDGMAAPAALVAAAEAQAAQLAAIPDETLAARGDDVRSVGRRAARLATGETENAGSGPGVLVAADLGPADVADLPVGTVAIALARGGPTAHAAIVARALGLPMVVGAGEELLDVAAGAALAVDGDAGTVTVDPAPDRAETARAAMAARARAAARDEAERHHETVTRDGHAVRVLVNAATAAEARAGLQAGADGAGLVRTELAFLDAPAWPDEAAHRHALAPVLDALRGHTATVRVLDFGGDKTPPFLDGERRRGLSLLLDAPAVLADQLRAILDAGRDTGLRVLLPMVETPVQLLAAHDVLLHAVWRVPGATRPPLGAMVETPQAAANAYRLALRADFLSIGTNDLAHATLGSDRFGTGRASAHHPRVLRLIARTVAAARVGGVVVEVCGEAASDPVAMPLLVGLGVDELSVGAARVAAVRRWVRALDKGEASRLAERALHAADAVEVEALVAGLSDRLRSLGQAGDDLDEAGDGVGRPVPLGGQP